MVDGKERKTSTSNFILRKTNLFFSVFFAFGVSLLFINILGWIIPLRNPSIYGFEGGKATSLYYDPTFKGGTNGYLTYVEALAQIDRRPMESDKDFIYRLTTVVNKAVIPYWFDDGIDIYHMRIPIWENFILWAYSYIEPRTYLRYEFTDYRRALERGIGLCSEYAIIMDSVLEKNGIEGNIIGLYGHVVSSAKVDEKWYILDANYGIVMPYSLEEIEQNSEIVLIYYKDTWNPTLFKSIYESQEDNISFENARLYTSAITADFEETAYIYKWIIPFGLMVPFVVVEIIQIMITSYQVQRRKKSLHLVDNPMGNHNFP
jgi:hypothetical protein